MKYQGVGNKKQDFGMIWGYVLHVKFQGYPKFHEKDSPEI